MCAAPTGTTTAIGVTPSTGPDPTGGTFAMGATLSPDAAALTGPHGSLTAVDPGRGSMALDPEEDGIRMAVRSDGRDFDIGHRTDAQKTNLERLHNALSGRHGPNALINVSRGWVEINGQIVEYLNEDPDKSKMLHEMRMLFHDILGQRYSDIIWHDYMPNDRASTSDPLPFQQRQTIDALKKEKIKTFPADQCPLSQIKELHIGKKLREGIADLLDKQKDTVGVSTQAQSRKKQLALLKEAFGNVDELMTTYYAAHPVPDLSALPNSQAKYDAIAQYRNGAKDFLTKAVKDNESLIRSKESSNPQVQKAIDELALEMSLTACVTRRDYDQMCLAFKNLENIDVKPCKTTPEFFLMRLSHLAATGGNVDQYITDHFDIAFRGLTEQDDKDAVVAQIATLITEINDELGDAQLTHLAGLARTPPGPQEARHVVKYNARVEQLDVVKKQHAITKALRDLATDLGNKRPDLAPIPIKMERVARRQDRSVETPLRAKASIKNGDYAPFANEILGKPGTVSRDKSSAIVTKQEQLIQELEAQPNQTNLRPIINKLKAIVQEQSTLGQYLAEKTPGMATRAMNKINPWHEAIPLSPIAARLA